MDEPTPPAPGPGPDPFDAAKRALREQIRAARARVPADVRPDGITSPADVRVALLTQARTAGLLDPAGHPDRVGAVSIAAYLAMTGEPDPGGITAAVRVAGGRVLLPVPLAGRELAWALDDDRQGTATRLRVPVPLGERLGVGVEPLLAPRVRVVLVPALAVDRSGHRLGQGGGYYDRLLQALADAHAAGAPTPRLVAVVHDAELLDAGAIPVSPHDRPVDAVLTPSGYLPLPA